jgi:isoprenylcysteine carboxyl methyltransferase (ICMT) family protein YpbQ
MGSLRQHRVVTAVCLALAVLGLARLAKALGGGPAGAALIVTILMALQTLVFAHPERVLRKVPFPISRRVLAVRATGFLVFSALALGSYVLQRAIALSRSDWRAQLEHADILWPLAPLLFSIVVDAATARPYVDEYWTLGKYLARPRRTWSAIATRDFGSSVIKLFFYPLMFVYVEHFLELLDQSWLPDAWTPAAIYDSSTVYYLFIDVAFGTAGYALSLQILRNRVYSVNPYPAGWLVTFICYTPFYELLAPVVFIYQWHDDWSVWTKDRPVIQCIWLAMILCCFVIYTWATIALGPRFSNLTFRGVVTSGPYRFMKHPAYAAKVASYWLITVPFIPMYGWAYALQQCVALTFMCLIYYFRAGFEEIHLMHYPEYRKYAASPAWNSSNTGKRVPG